VKRSALLVPLLLAGCDSGGLVWNSAMDELRGPPSTKALSETAHFEGGGLAFDYPAVLRVREEMDGGRQWKLEYGMYTLEVYAPKYEIAAADYLGTLQEVLAGGRSIDARPMTRGKPVALCGAPRTPVRVEIKMMGEWSRREAFDLPAPEGEARLLIFDDELLDPLGTALGRATRERVLGSLRCGNQR
jgi:hypothetical protein